MEVASCGVSVLRTHSLEKAPRSPLRTNATLIILYSVPSRFILNFGNSVFPVRLQVTRSPSLWGKCSPAHVWVLIVQFSRHLGGAVLPTQVLGRLRFRSKVCGPDRLQKYIEKFLVHLRLLTCGGPSSWESLRRISSIPTLFAVITTQQLKTVQLDTHGRFAPPSSRAWSTRVLPVSRFLRGIPPQEDAV